MPFPAWFQRWIDSLATPANGNGSNTTPANVSSSPIEIKSTSAVLVTHVHRVEFSGPLVVEFRFPEEREQGPAPAGPPTFTCISERIVTMPTVKLITYQIDSEMDKATAIREVAYSIGDGETQVQRFQQRVGAPTPITIEAPEDSVVKGSILDLDDKDNPASSATPFEGVWADKIGPQPAGAVTFKCVKERTVEVPDAEPTEPPATEPTPPVEPTPDPVPEPEPIPEPTEPPIGE